MIKTTFWDTLFFLLIINFTVSAQVNPWTAIATETQQKTLTKTVIHPTYVLDVVMLNTLFDTSSNVGYNKSVLLNFPVENEGFRTFLLSQSSVLHPKLAAKYPEIKSYTGHAVDGSPSSVRISYTPSLGLRAVIMEQHKETYHIAKVKYSKNQYVSYKNSDHILSDFGFECDVITNQKNMFGLRSLKSKKAITNGVLRKYRLALATSGEYADYFLDGSEANDHEKKTKVLAAVVATISRVNSIFERDFGVTMELVPNNDQILFLDNSVDPFNSNSVFGDDLNEQLQITLDNTDYIGADSYDVGHLFHKTPSSRSGNAGCIACVCIDGDKGSAFSQHPKPETDDFALLAAHEFGHQFGAYHVQSSSNCRSGFNSEVEPGSGSTIMGYAGICSPNVQQYPDDYFNYVDIRDVTQWVTNGAGCGSVTPLIGNAPIADAGSDYTIPIGTPFILEGVLAETNMDPNWTYCWEQIDPESPFSAQTPQSTWQVGPLFRSRLPLASPKRYMPQLSDLLAGNVPTWEMLPSVTRELNFVLTVRDNVLSGGQTASDAMKVNVTDTAGPFRVTSQTEEEVWTVGEEVTVTWDVANTDSAPVNAETIDVYVSVDGGYTYPNLVQRAIANNGSVTFPLPFITSTTEARVMVRGHNTIFYAVNTTNFTIQTSEFVVVPVASEKDFCKSEQITFDFKYRTLLDFDNLSTFSLTGLPDGMEAQILPNSLSGKHFDDTPITLVLTGAESLDVGSYEFVFKGTSEALEKQVLLEFYLFDDEVVSPNLVAPLTNADGIIPSVVFQWQEDRNIKSYTIEIASDESFDHLIDRADLEDHWYTSQNLVGDTHYFWRVTGTNSCDRVAVSPTYSFTTFCMSPSDFRTTDVGQSKIVLEWDDNGAGSLWEIVYGPAGFELETGHIATISTHPYTIEGLMSNTEYDIYLRTICAIGGNSVTSYINVKTAENYCETNRFFDSGGKNGPYSNNENKTTVMRTHSPDERIRVSFRSFELENCCDRLTIYDGPDQNAPILFSNGRMTIPSVFVSSHETGALTFVFTSDSSVTGSGWDAMVICETKPSCSAPTEFEKTKVTNSSLDFSWIANGSLSWEIEYGIQGFILGSGRTALATNTNYTLSELEPSTNYEVYLKAICSEGGYSNIVGPISATTLCNTLVAPFYERFMTTTTPNCWSESGNKKWNFVSDFYLPNDPIIQDHSANSDSYIAYIQTEKYGNDIDNSLISGFVDISGLVTPSIQFAAYSSVVESGPYNRLEVAFYDGTMWNAIATISETTFGWSTYFIDLSQYTITDAIQVRFTIQDDETNELHYIFIDDLVIDEMPTCIPPSLVRVSNTTQSAAEINWLAGDDNEVQWELEFGQRDFVLGNGERLLTDQKTMLLEHLSSGTAYEVYVRTSCENDGFSEWVGPLLCTTAKNYCGGDHFYDSGGETNSYQNNEYETTVIAPENDTDVISVTFTSFQLEGCCDYLTIYDGLDIDAPILGRYNGNTSPGTVKATNASGALTFLFTSDSSVTHQGWDASVTCLPKCIKPEVNNFVVDQVTKTTAVLTREDFLEGELWEVQYEQKDFVLGNGTIQSSSTATAALSGLVSNLEYDVYMRNSCSNKETGSWVGPISFVTDGNYCNGDHFYDSGRGTDHYDNLENMTTVIAPDTDGDRVSVSFNYFLLGSGDMLDVFDGPDKTAPLIGSYTKNIFPEVLVSTHVSGSLTFVFISDENGTDKGWEAIVNCDLQPKCAAPDKDDIQIVDVTTSTALVRRSHLSSTAWKLEYGSTGFVQGTGTSVDAQQEGLRLDDLTSGHSYDVYVSYGCEEGGYSDSSSPIRFTTLCKLVAVPDEYIQNGSFECGANGPWDILGTTRSLSECSHNFLVTNTEGANNSCFNEKVIVPTNGFYAAYTSFDGDEESQYILQQKITLPQSSFVVQQAVVSFDFIVDYNVIAGEAIGQRVLETALYDINDNLITIIDQQSFGLDVVQGVLYKKVSVDVSGDISRYLGQDIFIRFTAQISESFTGAARVMIDDVSLLIKEETLEIDRLDIGGASLMLYPNPAVNQLTVTSTKEIQKITLIDMLGQVVLVRNGLDTQKTDLDVASLQSGAYFMRLVTQTGVITKRILKE